MITEQVSRLVASTYADRFGLSVPEWRVVAHLGYSTSLSALAIAERTAMDKVKVSRALARLTARRLVRREVNPRDGRGAILTLTPSGRSVYERIVPAALAMEREILDALDPHEVAQLTALLDRLEAHVTRLDDADEREAAG
ncbi:MAG TPA: MarR family winged helix-turn-helix transcriptional regulator [Candidatus Sulfotelmatobacter sp.]|nr:MarR family winged helix-turn-helix transcriptional regulator [Candidatus Sulfotelmatobacter sp.]